MKKIIAGVFAIMLGMNISNLSANALSVSQYYVGDIDNNEVVDLSDISYLAMFLNGRVNCQDTETEQRLDVNLDGIIDSRDLSSLNNIIMNGSSDTEYYNNENNGIPSQTRQKYVKYSATNGTEITNYILNVSSDIPNLRSVTTVSDRYRDYSLSGVVKIVAHFDTYDAIGTGFVVDDNTIITVAHNLIEYHSTGSVNCNSIDYYLYDSYGVVQAINRAEYYHVPLEFERNREKDYAAITVNEDLSDRVINLGMPRNKIKDFNYSIFATGLCGSSEDNNLNNNIVTASGRLYGTKIDDENLYFDSEISASESGGPVYVHASDGSPVAIGLNVAMANTYNMGMRITPDIIHFLFNNSRL